jgi:hypothetical protein
MLGIVNHLFGIYKHHNANPTDNLFLISTILYKPHPNVSLILKWYYLIFQMTIFNEFI